MSMSLFIAASLALVLVTLTAVGLLTSAPAKKALVSPAKE